MTFTKDELELLLGALCHYDFDDIASTEEEALIPQLKEKIEKELEQKPKVMYSTDPNQKIYITENSRQALFNKIYRFELGVDKGFSTKKELYDFMFSAEVLEDYCLGRTDSYDSAYKPISKMLRKEYEEWKTKVK